MRNKIDFTGSPERLFLNPWQDGGLRLLAEPEAPWRSLPQAVIQGFAASAYGEINTKIRHFTKVTDSSRRFSRAIEYQTVPVVLEDASFRKSFVCVGERLFLTGAVGTRALNQFRWENAESESAPDELIDTYFSGCRAVNAGQELPLYTGMLEPDVDFAVPCRNTFNYYHFITESLTQLTALDGLEFEGNIYFHFPNQEDRQQPFAKAFVEALFPEFQGRVFFERAPKEYAKVLTAYDMVGGHFQAPEGLTMQMDAHLPRALRDKGGAVGPAARVPLSVNVVNAGLMALRERALKAIEGRDFSHLPKRFFVGRDSRKSRARLMAGEDLLFEHLQMFGFDYVVFESLSPLEQIALMAQAEMMVSYHGAGFTNMLFANPDMTLIEIGTLQTAQFRWGDFWPLANAAQCTYVNFFADFRTDNPLLEPHFGTDGIVPVSISEQAVGQVMGFVVSLLGHLPSLQTTPALSLLAHRLFKVERAETALALLEKHPDLVKADVVLCLLKADCHKALDEPKSELLALDLAHKVDPDRWQTLVRMIWCAKRCERPQVIRWALSRLKGDFPERHDAFVGNHEWVRYVA